MSSPSSQGPIPPSTSNSTTGSLRISAGPGGSLRRPSDANSPNTRSSTSPVLSSVPVLRSSAVSPSLQIHISSSSPTLRPPSTASLPSSPLPLPSPSMSESRYSFKVLLCIAPCGSPACQCQFVLPVCANLPTQLKIQFNHLKSTKNLNYLILYLQLSHTNNVYYYIQITVAFHQKNCDSDLLSAQRFHATRCHPVYQFFSPII